MRQEFMVSVRSTAEGYEAVVSGEDVGTARMVALDLGQVLRMAAAFMQTCCEGQLSFP